MPNCKVTDVLEPYSCYERNDSPRFSGLHRRARAVGAHFVCSSLITWRYTKHAYQRSGPCHLYCRLETTWHFLQSAWLSLWAIIHPALASAELLLWNDIAQRQPICGQNHRLLQRSFPFIGPLLCTLDGYHSRGVRQLPSDLRIRNEIPKV